MTDNEWQFTERIRRLAPGGGLVLGIGDDCAIYRPRGSREDLLFTTDLLIEGTHFLWDTHSAADVGWKALARGLSDIAAMGGQPRFCLVSLGLAQWTGDRWVKGFYRGLLRLAEQSGTALAGGDLSHGERMMCDIVVCGAAPRGTALRRDGARAGPCHLRFRRAGGFGLGTGDGARQGVAASCASGTAAGVGPVGAHEAARLGGDGPERRAFAGSAPDVPGIEAERGDRKAAGYRGATGEQALHGGEDYELLFTVPPRVRVPRELAGVTLTRIGTMRKGATGAVLLNGEPLKPLGYDHFRFL